jgi:hypothetical protein
MTAGRISCTENTNKFVNRQAELAWLFNALWWGSGIYSLISYVHACVSPIGLCTSPLLHFFAQGTKLTKSFGRGAFSVDRSSAYRARDLRIYSALATNLFGQVGARAARDQLRAAAHKFEPRMNHGPAAAAAPDRGCRPGPGSSAATAEGNHDHHRNR